MNRESRRWLDTLGMTVMETIGLHRGDHVLDFGCGPGFYVIPAAMLVEPDGVVYALDRDHEKLDTLTRRASAYGLANIEIAETAGSLSLTFDSACMDAMLVYDVLHSHFFTDQARRRLLREARRVLTMDGLLSIYPRHMSQDDAVAAAEQAGFRLDRRVTTTLHHNHAIVKDTVLNFRKKEQ